MRGAKPPAAALALAIVLVGSIALTYPPGAHTASGELVEVRMGALAAGSGGGVDFTEGAASVAGSLLSLRTEALYLNNTNASGVWYAKLVAVGSSGVSNVVSLTVGIDNGSASVPQVVGALGALTQASGSYVRLEAGSANRIYVTQAVSALGPDTGIALEVYAADDAAESAYVVTNANLTIT